MISSGSVSFDELEADSLEAHLASSGTLTIDEVRGKSSVFTTRGSGNIMCGTGTIDKVEALAYSSSDIRLQCTVGIATAASRGSGDVHIGRVTQSLAPYAYSSGDVEVSTEDGCSVQQSKNGSGSVRIKKVAVRRQHKEFALQPQSPCFDDKFELPPPPYSAE